MAKILRQNVGGIDFTVAGCALTGVCPTTAADYVKQITLSDGDIIEDGMMMVVTFANGNSAGNAPGTKTIYSSDQVNYYEDAQLTVPFTLAPEGCYEIEYTGTANAYTYTDYPVFQVGTVSGPVCDYRGHITSGDLWSSGDSVQCMLKEGKFLLLGGSGGDSIDFYDTEQDIVDDLPNLNDDDWVAAPDTGNEFAQPVDIVQAGNLHAVTSNAVAESLSYFTTEQKTGGKWIDGKPIYKKTIDCGALPNNTTKNVAHNITDLKFVIKVEGFAYATGGATLPIPYIASNAPTYNVSVAVNATYVSLKDEANLSSYAGSFVTLYYTKTTD